MTKIFYKKHFNAKKFTAKGFYKRKFAFSTAEVTHKAHPSGFRQIFSLPHPVLSQQFSGVKTLFIRKKLEASSKL
jgi:hypothetical protein